MAAEPQSVRLARSEIVSWFAEQQAPDDALAASIAVAVSEAVGNVVRHAYPGDRTGRVEIEAEVRDSRIVILVKDGGTGLEARPEREHHGMGLPVIGRMADGVMVDSDESGTTIEMRFDVAPAHESRRFRARGKRRRFAVCAR